MVFVDTVGDMLVDLAQSDLHFVDLLISAGNVLQDLKLMIAAQHYRNLVAFSGPKLISLCWSPSLCKISSRLRPSASTCISIACLLEAGEMISRTHTGAPGSGCSVDNPDNSLIGSIPLLGGLFQRPRAVHVGSHFFLCKL